MRTSLEKQLAISKTFNKERCERMGWLHVEEFCYTHDLEIGSYAIEVKIDIGKTVKYGNLFIEYLDVDIIDGKEFPRYRNEKYDFLNYVVCDETGVVLYQYLFPASYVNQLKKDGNEGVFEIGTHQSYNAKGTECTSYGYKVPEKKLTDEFLYCDDEDIDMMLLTGFNA